MTIYRTAYDTSACVGSKMQEVYDKTKEAIIMGHVQKNEYGIYEITSGTSFSDQIPGFLHPIALELDDLDVVIVADMRAYYRLGAMGLGTQATVFDTAGYNLTNIRARLTKKFIGDYSSSLLGFSAVPVNVYTSIIADAIVKRLNLNIVDHYTIQLASGIYFYTLFEDRLKNNSPEFITKVSIQLSRSLNVKAMDVRDIAEKLSAVELTDIESLCSSIKLLLNNVRVKDLNFITLASMMGGLWYGPQGRELINVSLENPPTLMALIFHAYSDRGFRKTGLGQLLENNFFKKQSQNYIGAINNLSR